MSVDLNPEDLFEIAKKLKDGTDGPEIRTLLNRCYYSCFLQIKKKTGKNGIDNYLGHENAYRIVNRDKKLGSMINRLYVYRLIADYSLLDNEEFILERVGSNYKINIDTETRNKALKTAKKFFENYK